jgi:hypothetical protein
MKKTIIVVTLLVLLALPLAMSTVSAKAEKIPITATQAGGAVAGTSEYDYSKDGWLTYTAQTAGVVTITLNDINGKTSLNSAGNQHVVVNLKTGEGIVKFEPMRWILKDAGGNEIGAFEGFVHGRVTDYTLQNGGVAGKFAWAGVVHVVFKGSGQFEGQMLVLEGERAKAGTDNIQPLAWEGFLLTIP